MPYLIYYKSQDLVASRYERKILIMRKHQQAWHYLIALFVAFWLIFATILIINGFPFFVISIALTTIALLSVLVIALAWAFQNNW